MVCRTTTQGWLRCVVLTPDTTNSLTLTQWLPGVSSWRQAADALESLLNQLSVWRAAVSPAACSARTAARWAPLGRPLVSHPATTAKLHTLFLRGV
jgi:hypothetical protein